PSSIGGPDLIFAQVPFPNSEINRVRGHTHPFFALPQRLVLVYQLCNIDTRTDVPGKSSLRVMAWDALVRYPAILAIISPQAILHNEWLPRIECLRVNREALLQVVSVNAFSPAVSKLLFHPATGKIQPWFVKECAELVHAGHPDENGRSIRDDLET